MRIIETGDGQPNDLDDLDIINDIIENDSTSLNQPYHINEPEGASNYSFMPPSGNFASTSQFNPFLDDMNESTQSMQGMSDKDIVRQRLQKRVNSDHRPVSPDERQNTPSSSDTKPKSKNAELAKRNRDKKKLEEERDKKEISDKDSFISQMEKDNNQVRSQIMANQMERETLEARIEADPELKGFIRLANLDTATLSSAPCTSGGVCLPLSGFNASSGEGTSYSGGQAVACVKCSRRMVAYNQLQSYQQPENFPQNVQQLEHVPQNQLSYHPQFQTHQQSSQQSEFSFITYNNDEPYIFGDYDFSDFLNKEESN